MAALSHRIEAGWQRALSEARPWLKTVAAGCLSVALLPARAQAPEPDPSAAGTRPAIKWNRWQEDWSALSDPRLATEPLDDLKYMSLSVDNPQSYASLGATLRERFETNGAANFGVGGTRGDSWVIQRLQLHADVHVDERIRLFAQLQDDRAFDKRAPSPVDQDRADLQLAFAEYVTTTSAGTLKARFGRQDFAFDLQRFVSSRDGPNVRQAFDAAWLDWEMTDWRFIGFVSQPVQYKTVRAFDDSSNGTFRFDTLRVERHVLGKNELSAYWSLFERESAHYGDAVGQERRQVFDLRFAGATTGLDWDIEAMLQTGSVGASTIRAWAFGPRAGYSWATAPWRPRLGLQVDVASGDARPGDGREGTFNPLFPNGYYFSLAGYTGYANVVHVKPSVTLKPLDGLTVLAATGFLWRETVADAIYVQPNVPVAGTAGKGDRWSGSYAQLRMDYAVNRHLATALEAVAYQIGDTIRRGGGHDSNYLGLEMKYSW